MTERRSSSGSPVAITGFIPAILMSRRVKELSPAMRYLLAIAIVLLVAGVRLALLRTPTTPFAIFYLGVAVASSLFGLGPGLLALAVSAGLADLLFADPYRVSRPSEPTVAMTLVFLGGAGPVAVLCALFRRSLLEAHRIGDLLRESREALVQSQARAQERTALLEAIQEAVPAAVFVTQDPEARTIKGNRLGHELIGIPVGQNLSMTAPGGELPACTFLRDGVAIAPEDLPVQRAARGADISGYAFDVVQPDGTLRHLFGSAKPLLDEDGKPCGAVGAFVDVTPLEQAKREARANERGLRAIADSMPQIVWAASPDGRVDYMNRKWYELTGADPNAVGDPNWLPMVHPDDRQRTLDTWYESVRTGRPFEVEYRLRFMPTGEYRWHLGRALPVRDEQGRITRWYGTCTDMQDRKMVEEALRASGQRKTEFLAMLSHELRNPLAPIRNSVYLLGRIDPGSEQARRAVSVIDRQSQHLVRLVDDLLDLTRIERGKIHLQCTRLDLRALLDDVAEDHHGLFQNAGVRLVVDLGAEEVPVRADAARLAQAVGNLLQNAAKFTPRGGVTTLRLAREGEAAAITVADTGDGIPPDVMDQLFQPFVQAEKTLHRSLGGLGLGLTLVKGLLELHGGTVRAESAGLGQGATFTIRLPLEQPAASQEAAPRAAEHASSARRVLVIEDNADTAETVRALLELAQHQVEVASSGPEGLERARTFRPDVVICDIGLPGLSGFEVARAMRADPGLASIGLIALTGYAQPQDVEEARAAGFNLHLSKPLPPELLEQSLREAEAAVTRPR